MTPIYLHTVSAPQRGVSRWTLHGAWVKVLRDNDPEGGHAENSIEKLTVCYQYWSA